MLINIKDLKKVGFIIKSFNDLYNKIEELNNILDGVDKERNNCIKTLKELKKKSDKILSKISKETGMNNTEIVNYIISNSIEDDNENIINNNNYIIK